MIELLTSLLLADFSSGSSINFYQDRFYLIGDDANEILILDKDYHKQDSIQVFNYKASRIPKNVKADFETSAIVKENAKDHLLVLGSASRDQRMEGLLLPLEEPSDFTPVSFADFVARIREQNIGEINLEGSTVVNHHFIWSNRANSANPNNTLIITTNDFWKHQQQAPIVATRLVLPVHGSLVPGVSELCYVASRDLLLLTLSSEQTSNAYEDGAIGNSYIGWINAASTQLNQSILHVDGMINLSASNEVFRGEKIEGLCVERVEGNSMIVHLISDNDDGKSRLFKIKLTIK